jgi:hypothetical protein
MMRSSLAFGTLVLTAAVAAGCKADRPALSPTPDAGGTGPASTPSADLPAPTATAPASTPLDSAPVRGSSPGATTVVVQGSGARTAVGLVLPDGSFCIDVPLAAGAPNTLRVVTVSQGRMSEAKVVEVVQDPSAAAPTSAPCGLSPGPAGATCTDSQSACNPACNGCKEDMYQPNLVAGQAPALNMKMSYTLQLCPCRPDWFTFVAYAGQSVGITATYAKSGGFDLDIALFRGADVLPAMTGNAPIATSTAGTSGSSATRTITFTASVGGSYYLRIAAPSGAMDNGSYTLTTK